MTQSSEPVSGSGEPLPPPASPPPMIPGQAAPGYPPPSSAPPGNSAPGYAPPGYAPPGYAPPGYAAPGYAPPGYAPPAAAQPPYAPGGYPPPGYPSTGYSVPGYAPPGYAPPGGYLPPAYPSASIAPNGQRLAGFGDRLLASLIDGAIFAGVALVLVVPLLILIGVAAANSTTYNDDGTVSGPNPALIVGILFGELAIGLIGLAASYLYQVELIYRRGQTVGKRAMKIQVVCLNPNAPMTRGVAAKRWAIQYVVGGMVGIFALLDGLWQLWDKPFQQCLHDKVAQTVVVKLPA